MRARARCQGGNDFADSSGTTGSIEPKLQLFPTEPFGARFLGLSTTDDAILLVSSL